MPNDRREAARVEAVRQQEKRAAVITRGIIFVLRGDQEKITRIIADFAAQEVFAATQAQAGEMERLQRERDEIAKESSLYETENERLHNTTQAQLAAHERELAEARAELERSEIRRAFIAKFGDGCEYWTEW